MYSKTEQQTEAGVLKNNKSMMYLESDQNPEGVF